MESEACATCNPRKGVPVGRAADSVKKSRCACSLCWSKPTVSFRQFCVAGERIGREALRLEVRYLALLLAAEGGNWVGPRGSQRGDQASGCPGGRDDPGGGGETDGIPGTDLVKHFGD